MLLTSNDKIVRISRAHAALARRRQVGSLVLVSRITLPQGGSPRMATPPPHTPFSQVSQKEVPGVHGVQKGEKNIDKGGTRTASLLTT